jgi:branched-chain amino acid transport system permease protein
LRGDYIAVVTLAFGEIVGSVVANGDQVRVFGGTLTAGGKGITPIDKIDLPLLPPFGALDLRPWYWFALVLVVFVLVVNLRLRDSRLGRAWLALRDDEQAAAHAGVPIARTKLAAYGTGAGLGGLFGAFLASFLNTVNAVQFEFSFSIFVLAMVVVGGLGSIWGVVLGAVVLSALNGYVLPDLLGGLDLTQLSYGIYGTLLVFVVIVRPAGLWPR